MYIKLHLLGFTDHVILCDLNNNPWGNEQNNIETYWDSFVSIYYFTLLRPKKKKKGDCENYKQCHVMLFVSV